MGKLEPSPLSTMQRPLLYKEQDCEAYLPFNMVCRSRINNPGGGVTSKVRYLRDRGVFQLLRILHFF